MTLPETMSYVAMRAPGVPEVLELVRGSRP